MSAGHFFFGAGIAGKRRGFRIILPCCSRSLSDIDVMERASGVSDKQQVLFRVVACN